MNTDKQIDKMIEKGYTENQIVEALTKPRDVVKVRERKIQEQREDGFYPYDGGGDRVVFETFLSMIGISEDSFPIYQRDLGDATEYVVAGYSEYKKGKIDDAIVRIARRFTGKQVSCGQINYDWSGLSLFITIWN